MNKEIFQGRRQHILKLFRKLHERINYLYLSIGHIILGVFQLCVLYFAT